MGRRGRNGRDRDDRKPWVLLIVFALATFAGVGTAFVPTGSFTTVDLDRPGSTDVVNQRGGALDLTVANCSPTRTNGRATPSS